MPKVLNYSFCTISLYENYLIAVMDQGEHISPDRNQVLVELAETYYSDRSFVYITHRKHSYSVDPSIYLKTAKIKNLAGFAVVAEVPTSKANAEIERLFLNKPFEIFSDVESALNWTKVLLKKP